MGLESPTVINDLNTSWPLGSDVRSEGDDHLRNIKTVLKNSLLYGALATRPAAGTAGRWFASTDENIWYFDNGTSWLDLTSTAVAGNIWTVSSQTGNFSPGASDDGTLYFVDTSGGNVTVTLPAEATAGSAWYARFIKTTSDTNLLLINDDASSLQYTLAAQGDTLEMMTDGTTWFKAIISIDPLTTVATGGATSLTQSADTQLAIDTAVVNPFGMVNTGSDRIDIKVAGDYFVTARMSSHQTLSSKSSRTVKLTMTGTGVWRGADLDTGSAGGNGEGGTSDAVFISGRIVGAVVGDSFIIEVNYEASGTTALLNPVTIWRLP